MTLDELIAALESAKGPSRELDEAIMAIFYKREARHIGTREDDGTGWKPVADDVWVDPKTDKWRSTHALEFTASLDAALTLVPEGWFWRLANFDETADGALAELVNPDVRVAICGEHDEPATALTIAALKARRTAA